MNSPTHSLIALTVLSKKEDTTRNWAIFLGSIIPDAVIYLWAPYQAFIRHRSWPDIWNTLYFEAPMQNLIAYVNSIPIYALLATVGFVFRVRLWGKLCLFFSLAALLHIAFDLPVHNHDAYRHFWPLSDWRFYSPLSYYETTHHARWVSLAEAAIAGFCIVVLWRRFAQRWVKLVLTVLAFAYISIQFAIAANATIPLGSSILQNQERNIRPGHLRQIQLVHDKQKNTDGTDVPHKRHQYTIGRHGQ